MIERQEVMSLATDLSLAAGVIEKDYVLGWILAGIYADPELPVRALRQEVQPPDERWSLECPQTAGWPSLFRAYRLLGRHPTLIRPYEWARVVKGVDRLLGIAGQPAPAVRDGLRELVPEYRPGVES